MPATPPQPLPELTVHVWRFRIDDADDYGRARSILSPDEVARADRYLRDVSRRTFTIARARLRGLLSAYLSLEPQKVPLTTQRYGKTVLEKNQCYPNLQFNLSHSGDLGLVALALHPVGVDIERHGPPENLEDIAGTAFLPSEVERWKALPEEERVRGFFDLWVAKEAFIKATGVGLGFGLHNFEVCASPGQPELTSVHGDERLASRWTLGSLDSGSGYSSAWAIRYRNIRPQTFDLMQG